MDLVKAMGSGSWDETLLEALCGAVSEQLEGRLKDGLTAQDCGGAFPVAAAWMALGALYDSGGSGQVESFTAGDLTVRAGDFAAHSQQLREQAERLMAPYLAQTGFACQGAPG